MGEIFVPSIPLYYQDEGFLTALEYSDKRKRVFRISTGSNELEYVYCLLYYQYLTIFFLFSKLLGG